MTPAQKTRLARLREFRNGNPVAYYPVNGRKCMGLPFGTELAGRGEGKKASGFLPDPARYARFIRRYILKQLGMAA